MRPDPFVLRCRLTGTAVEFETQLEQETAYLTHRQWCPACAEPSRHQPFAASSGRLLDVWWL